MNDELGLKLQAYLDGELPQSQAPEVLRLLSEDPEARQLHDELKSTQSLLRGSEPERRLEESREFYWSKICRAIEGAEASRSSPNRPAISWWLRWFAPLTGVGLLAIFLSFSGRVGDPIPSKLAYAQEIETPLDDTSLMTFRSESEGISVVWVNSQ